MSFTDEYLELRKKRKKEEEVAPQKTSPVKRPLFVNKTAPLYEDIAPVKKTSNKKTTTKKEEKEERTWFTKGAFDDGYQFGDISKTILGTATDVSENLTAGVLGMGEKVVDAGAYVAGGVGDLFGADEFAEKTKKFISKDLYNEEKIAKKIILGSEENSVLGEKSDSLVQSAGQLGATIGLQAVGVPWFVTTGLTGFGAEAENAFNEGATYGQAGLSAAIAAGAEILTEKIGGGISFGGKTLSDVLTHRITTGISNKVVRTLTKLGVDMVGEGTEEILSGVMGAVGQKITYEKDKELTELFSSEDALESFIGGSVLGGGMGGINAVKARKHGVDYTSGMTDSEEKVVNKVFEDRVAEEEKNGKLTERQKAKIYDEVISDMEKGGISIDTIEEVLGGDRYSNYKSVADHQDAIQQEHDTLNRMKQGEMTGEQLDRLAELKEQIKTFKETNERDNLKSQLGEEVFGLAKNSRLVESYNERTKRGQAFEADYTKYDAKQQETIKKATESGILNNTRRTHEFVDMIAKISADKGVLFDFTNNEKLKGSGFAVDGKTVNGFVTKDGVTLNIDSAKSLNSVVGHEITHVLEGTEFYNALQQTVLEYARSKGDYDARVSSIRDLYRDVKDADVANELTADLVGDYLFTDPDFINNLSVKNRNVFQKVYDEIKYLCKVATAGSKEARELEKVKRAFEKAYKEGDKEQTDTKYSVSDSDAKKPRSAQAQRDEGYMLSESKFYQLYSAHKLTYGNRGGEISSVIEKLKRDGFISSTSIANVLPTSTMRYFHHDANGDVKFDNVVQSKYAPHKGDYVLFVPSNYVTKDDIIKNGFKPLDYEIAVVEYDYQPYYELYVNTYNKNIRYSLSDSDGKQLSKDNKGRDLSPAVQSRFGKSKVVDEDGNLKAVYHGTATGEFSIFDKSKGSVEGDFGSGFYFTDNEADVSEHYEGGGPDFDNKVARLAEQIENEEDIDYEEAEERARNELYKGSHKFEVYLNIENPAIVGKTMLFDPDSYFSQYSEEDYDSYEDYEGDVEQLITDDIDGIIWDIERNIDIYSTEGIPDILYEAITDGGIGLEELKAKLNNLYLEDSNGNLVANEVARQIIESLGYDGIIDPTVSGKWNMNIAEGTKHYIVFKPNQIKAVTNQTPTDNPDIHRSLSRQGEQFAPARNLTYGKDIALTKQESEVSVPVSEEVSEVPVAETQELFPDDLAPMPEDDTERLDSLTDEDAPPEAEAPHYQSDTITVDDPFYDRDIGEVGNRKVKAYMYENPEVKPFFQQEARGMLDDLRNTTKGERTYNSHMDYEYGYEYAWSGTKRHTTDDIAELLDVYGYTYDQIEKGLNAIIEDNGAENNAVSKRIEFMLNDRLMYGYKDVDGRPYEPNQDYINLLNEKQITEYSKEAFDAFMANADDYAPISEEIEEVAPVAEPVKAAPVAEKYEAIRPKPTKEPRMARATPEEQARAKILVEEPKVEKKKAGWWSWAKEHILDSGMVFEDLSLKSGNRELQAKWNFIRGAQSMAQRFMGKGANGVRALNDLRNEVESSGKTESFYEYVYHLHNVDRMSLRSNARKQAKQLLKDNPLLSQLSKTNTFADVISKVDTDISQVTFEELFSKELLDKNSALFNSEEYRETKATDLYNKFKELVKLSKVEDKPVFGYDVTAKMSTKTAAELEKANPEFKKWAQDLYKINSHLRDQMVQKGVISRETADLWAEMYPHYVPIRRAGYEGAAINVALDTNRTGINAPIKRATGGNRDILPLFNTMGERTMQTYRAIAKNSFGVELKNTLNSPIIAKEKASVDSVIDSVDNEEGLLKEGKNGMNPTFTVFVNGERVEFEITEEMYEALRPTTGILAKTSKSLNAFNSFRRGLITEYNPAFLATNAIKDAQDVLMNSQHPVKTYIALPKAALEMARNGQFYEEYMDNGGEQNTYFDGQNKTFDTKEKGAKKLLGIPPLSWISKANNVIERLPRLAEYIASREAGRSIEVSMLDAARVTTNFQAGGDLTKFINRNGGTFFGASVQGAVQQARNIREAKANGLKGALGLAGKIALAGLPAMVFNHLMWDDDEEYEELSDYVKRDYYVVAKFGDGQFVRIPKGRIVSVVQNAFEQIGNAVTGEEVDLFGLGELMLSNIAPSNPIENNVFAPVLQSLTNKAWYGGDLVPTRLQDLPVAEQYDESTDAISKWLGEKLNISPYKLNYVLDQYSGGVGDMVLPYLTQEAERGKNSMFAPILDKFTTDSVMKNQNVSDFYDTKDELAVTANSSDATDEDVLKSKFMNSVNSELGKLYGEKREIQNSDLPDDEKYEAVREIQKQIEEMAELSLHTYEDVNIEGDYGNIGDKYFHLNEEGEWQKLSADQTTKYLVTKDADGSSYATNGDVHYRWYEPGEDSDAEPGWRKITDDQLEKQREVTKGLDITPEEYWGNKEEYDYAYEHPENYAVAKAVGGYSAYRTYSSELYDIKADKDSNGKSITGSRKEKVADYINGLDADYYTKIILFKSEYNSEDTYNYEIIEYLNGREDISFEEEIAILRKLGFEVDNQGNISW